MPTPKEDLGEVCIVCHDSTTSEPDTMCVWCECEAFHAWITKQYGEAAPGVIREITTPELRH